MASELRVNSSTNRSGLGTITYTDSGPIISGVGTFTNGFTVDGTQTTVKSLKLTGDNYNANWFKTSSTFRLNDNAKLNIGSADDMQQYHDGTTSYIKNTTGGLRIENTASNIGIYASDANGDIIMRAGGATSSENAIVAVHHGEVTLAFNGSTKLTTTNTGLTLTGIINGPTQLNLSNTGGDLINVTSTTAASRSTIKFNTNGNDWEIGARGSSADNPNNFYFFDSASTSYRLLIDSDGAAFFKGVSAGAKGTINLESQDPFIRLYDTNGEANKRKWDIRNIGQSGYNELDFRTINDANNSFNSVMQIEHGGDVNISDGNLRVASGHGIDFSATGDGSGSMQNELLDDYEEGTWTPLVRNSSGTGTAGSANYGYYTKVGNVVHAHATVHWTALNSGTTNAYALVVGFPYATKNATNYRCQHILGAQVTGVQAGGAGYNLSLAFDGNLSVAYLLGVNSASTNGSNYTHTPTINSSGTIYGLSITYLTD